MPRKRHTAEEIVTKLRQVAAWLAWVSVEGEPLPMTSRGAPPKPTRFQSRAARRVPDVFNGVLSSQARFSPPAFREAKTTMLNYGHVESHRQAEIIRKLGTNNASASDLSNMIETLKSYAEKMASNQGV